MGTSVVPFTPRPEPVPVLTATYWGLDGSELYRHSIPGISDPMAYVNAVIGECEMGALLAIPEYGPGVNPLTAKSEGKIAVRVVVVPVHHLSKIDVQVQESK